MNLFYRYCPEWLGSIIAGFGTALMLVAVFGVVINPVDCLLFVLETLIQILTFVTRTLQLYVL